MFFAMFDETDGRQMPFFDMTTEGLDGKMSDHAKSFFPDPDALGRDEDEVLSQFDRDCSYLGTFSEVFEVPVSLWLFANLTGGATYSPEAIRVGCVEVDCENMQVLGVGNGATPLEAWNDLLESEAGMSLREQGWPDESIVAYPLAGAAQHNWGG